MSNANDESIVPRPDPERPEKGRNRSEREEEEKEAERARIREVGRRWRRGQSRMNLEDEMRRRTQMSGQ